MSFVKHVYFSLARFTQRRPNCGQGVPSNVQEGSSQYSSSRYVLNDVSSILSSRDGGIQRSS